MSGYAIDETPCHLKSFWVPRSKMENQTPLCRIALMRSAGVG